MSGGGYLPASGVRLRGGTPASGYRAARAGSGAHSTIVQNGGDWGWPNSGEPLFLFVADVSWMVVGQTIAADDGVLSGVLTITAITPELLLVTFDAVSGPPGGTAMLDGATLTLVS